MIKEKYQKLVNVYKSDHDILAIILDDMAALDSYVHEVYKMETALPVLKTKYSGQELRDKRSLYDGSRHLAHERAIMAVKRLNRFSEKAGLKLFFEGDTTDRIQIANFCMQTVNEFFDKRSGIPDK